MIIAIDLTSLSYHMTGIERYAACMTEKMLQLDKVNEYRLIFRDSVYPIFEKYIDDKKIQAYVIHGKKKVIFLQIILQWNLYKIYADRYIFFAFTSPIFFVRKGIINTIHDMGAWDSADAMTTLQKIYWRVTYKISAYRSEKIITVSNFSKNRISKLLKYPQNKIYVIYSAVYDRIAKTYNEKVKDIKIKYSLPNKYIMTLSTLEPRKNIELLLKAYTNIQDKVDYDLVLVGRKGWKMDEIIENYNSKERIHITGFVEDEHISTIYKNALCFIFPSLYEGFGLPPIEALTLGTPVIASNAASMPEILMNQAVFFKNNDEKALENVLLHLENNVDSMPHELNQFQKKNYSFEVSAERLLKLIR